MKERLSEVSDCSTHGPANAACVADMRVRLSIFWTFAVLNYIYADVFTVLRIPVPRLEKRILRL